MISLKHVTKTFQIDDSLITAVDDLSLDVHKGEIFGVIGYSGAGKSTLIRLLNRLEEPTDGTIFVDGNDITTLTSKKLRLARQEIGMIFQHFNLLWSRTTEENIAFPLEIAGIPKEQRQKRVQELIDLVGLTGREQAYPSQLSGGQKQRVGIARALANDPKVLLCDEATSALDPETTNAILDLLVDINEKLGITIVMITHEMHVIQKICHRVAVMENGKIVEQGNVIDIFTNPQQLVTKKFVQQVIKDEKDDDIEHILTNVSGGSILRLQFVGKEANHAFISEIAKKFAITFNILQGNITQTNSGPIGNLFIQLTGDPKEVEQAIQSIEKTEVKVEVIRK